VPNTKTNHENVFSKLDSNPGWVVCIKKWGKKVDWSHLPTKCIYGWSNVQKLYIILRSEYVYLPWEKLSMTFDLYKFKERYISFYGSLDESSSPV